MKFRIITLTALLGFFSISCTDSHVIESGEQEESIPKPIKVSETEEIVEEVKEKNPVEEQIESRYAYDRDWELIKEAILSKDDKKIQNWIDGDQLKAEDISMIFQDPNVIKALKDTKYSDLKSEEQNDEQMLVFYYEELSTDDEGNEIGMSISLYLKQGDPDLLIANLLAAG